ncbi:MAG: ATP-binding cassette domain-containing protein [Phycisphaerales bacterium]|nr:ATP-binding cassette domain-containing protein [Phycisphaerales bacterium]
MAVVEASDLSKVFRVPQRESGLGAALRSVLRRRYTDVKAVDRVSFSIEPGEVVGFLGPNGAGKTTTLKILTGLLHPNSGGASVLGHVPWKRENAFLRRISLVMGQRSQLSWDLPVMDSFVVQLAVYDVEPAAGKATLDELVQLLDLSALLKKPVRNLSLGERMKCELCCSLLYRPEVLFLDEPTIGVDITMQARIRQFIADYNRRYRSTVILTSHYMADVTALCKRIIVINHGRILFDGPLGELVARLAPFKMITVDLERDIETDGLETLGPVASRNGRKITFKIPKAEAAATTARLLAQLPVLDLTIADPPIEDVIEQIFRVPAGDPAAAPASTPAGAAQP